MTCQKDRSTEGRAAARAGEDVPAHRARSRRRRSLRSQADRVPVSAPTVRDPREPVAVRRHAAAIAASHRSIVLPSRAIDGRAAADEDVHRAPRTTSVPERRS
ncbi:MAG TPA: hypothetical protein VEP48_05045 [Methylomirabilota bacterium]|nr:hypothetical protein [Methylomirabilota bacterium]